MSLKVYRQEAALRGILGRATILKVDPVLHRIFAKGRWTRLTKTEFRLLDAIVVAKGRPVPVTQLLQLMEAGNKRSGPAYIKLYIWYLRQKIEDDPADPKLILTERGLGYRFVGRVVVTTAM
jgi:two-component system KDP operon response regulator KdpE